MSERVRDTGEFVLIDRLIAALPEAVRGTDAVHGAGDDCAWWSTPDSVTVATSDALVEGVHFRLDWTDWRSLGHKMLAVNLSDLASMGCTPRVAIVTLALTGDELVSDLEEMYRGAGELAAFYDVVIAGGDIVRTPGPMLLNVTMLGELGAEEQPMTRSQAEPGDAVLVSGTLGASAAGLRLLQDGDRGAATAELLVGAHVRPQPRVSLGQWLRAQRVRCCMDLSDGLAGDLPKILDRSGVGATLNAEAIPVLPALRALYPQEYLQLALHGGEDYELLFTAPADLAEALIATAGELGATLTRIGEITGEQGIRLLDESGGEVPLVANAWDHFPATD